MNKIESRRAFIRKAGMIVGFSQTSFLGWATGFSTLFREGVNPTGEFSLLKLETLLSAYRFPFIDQFSTDSFKSLYMLYNLYGDHAAYAGELSLHSANEGKTRQFFFSVGRQANNGIMNRGKNFKYIVSGDLLCRSDVTFSPEKWNVSSKIALSEDGDAFGGAGLTYTGEVKSGEICLKTGGKSIRKSIDSMPLSWKWGLLAVVQKMAEESLPELQFSMLDEFDAIYKNQKLKFRRKVSLDCGNDHLIAFKVFELTGDGVIPTVYWVDNMNRTVFVISGMEAYVLEE